MEKENGYDDSREFIYFAGGLALMVLGAGLIASHPAIRKSVAKVIDSVAPDLTNRLGELANVRSVGSDIQRYMRLRAM